MKIQNNSRNGFAARNWDFLVYLAGMAVLAVVLIKKCRYGFGNIDESFYLTIPYRLSQGDGLFINEWHLSQMSGFLLMPLVKAYLKTNGSTDGIILAFRYIYVCVQLLATTVIFVQLRKYSKAGALTAALLWCVYAPFGIMALSYNSMGIICLTLALVLLVSSDKIPSYVIAGVLFACAVLCCPFLAAVYGLYAVLTLVFNFTKIRYKPEYLGIKKFIWVTAGIAVPALCFIAFVFSKLSVKELLDVLTPIMNDPEHYSGIFYKIRSYIEDIIFGNEITPVVCILYAAVLVTGVVSKSKRVKSICMVLSVCVAILHLWSYIHYNRYINHLMLPVNICAFICCAISWDKRFSKLFHGIWIPGMIYTGCIHFSSNMELYAIASAAAVPMVCSVIIVIEAVKNAGRELKTPGRAVFLVPMIALLLVQGGAELYFRWNDVFWEKSIEEQTELLTSGPEAGLLVTEEKKQMYEGYEAELAELNMDGNVLFLSENTWLYLCGTYRNAGYSAWLSGVNPESIQRLHDYYEFNPQKKPDYIFIESVYSLYAGAVSDIADYQELTTEAGNLILIRK